jgi:hypothetical protein
MTKNIRVIAKLRQAEKLIAALVIVELLFALCLAVFGILHGWWWLVAAVFAGHVVFQVWASGRLA